jgi:hypothetical protein
MSSLPIPRHHGAVLSGMWVGESLAPTAARPLGGGPDVQPAVDCHAAACLLCCRGGRGVCGHEEGNPGLQTQLAFRAGHSLRDSSVLGIEEHPDLPVHAPRARRYSPLEVMEARLNVPSEPLEPYNPEPLIPCVSILPARPLRLPGWALRAWGGGVWRL